MEILVNKCEKCSSLFEKDSDLKKHIKEHEIELEFIKKYSLHFENDNIPRQRTKEWFENLKKDILIHAGDIGYEPWSYGFYRTLDDNNHPMYRWSFIVNSVCQTCFKQYSQPYDANTCLHQKGVR